MANRISPGLSALRALLMCTVCLLRIPIAISIASFFYCLPRDCGRPETSSPQGRGGQHVDKTAWVRPGAVYFATWCATGMECDIFVGVHACTTTDSKTRYVVTCHAHGAGQGSSGGLVHAYSRLCTEVNVQLVRGNPIRVLTGVWYI